MYELSEEDSLSEEKSKMKVILSKHAKERAKEFQLTIYDVIDLVNGSTEERVDKNFRKFNSEKYKGKNDNIYHTRNGVYVFVIAKTTNRFTNEPCLLVVTLTNQLINLNSRNFKGT